MRSLLLAMFALGCGGSVESPATADGGTDTATDGATSDAVVTEGGGCGETPPIAMCFTGGGAGRACTDFGYPMTCTAGIWACPKGTNTECGCMATAGLMPGDMCPDADAGSPPDGGACDCIANKLAWQWDGGLVAYRDKSSIAPCRTFTRTREGSGAAMTCNREMLKCGAGDAIDMGDVQAALAAADVVTAFKSAPVLYGRDSRPVDGQVYRIDYGGKVVEVGDDCGAISACKPIPEGVKKLVSLLKALDAGGCTPI